MKVWPQMPSDEHGAGGWRPPCKHFALFSVLYVKPRGGAAQEAHTADDVHNLMSTGARATRVHTIDCILSVVVVDGDA